MIRLVREVDWSKFTNHPCEHLRKKDARIEDLAKETGRRLQVGILLQNSTETNVQTT